MFGSLFKLPRELDSATIVHFQDRCELCHSTLAIARERNSGKPVRNRGRALMKCTQCGNYTISSDPLFDRKRYKAARVITWCGAVAYFVAVAVIEYFLEPLVFQRENTLDFIVPVSVVVSCFAFAGLCYCTTRAILPATLDKRIEWIAYAFLCLAGTAICIWMAIQMSASIKQGLIRTRQAAPPITETAPP